MAIDPIRQQRALAGHSTHLDSLHIYLAQVGRLELMQPEEQWKLALEFRKNRDPRLAYRLVTGNLRLVVKIALGYRNAQENLLDLIQQGNMGLMLAVEHFDPARGVKLSSYAHWWIRAYILKFIMDTTRLVKIGTTQAQRKLFFRLRNEQEKLLREGFVPDSLRLAERIGVSEKDVVEMQKRLGEPEASLDAPMEKTGEQAGRTLMDTLDGKFESPEAHVLDEDLRSQVRGAMTAFRRTVNRRDLAIWDGRLATVSPITFTDLGASLGVTRQRAQQLEKGLKNRFKEHLKTAIPEAAADLRA